VATSSTRTFFANQQKKDPNAKPEIETLAKDHILRKIEDKLRESLGGDGVDVQYELLTQAEEAKYEYAAAEAALTFAIDLPLDAMNTSRKAALAWGNGSTQGYCFGHSPDETISDGGIEKVPVPLALQLGLKKSKTWIEAWMASKGSPRPETPHVRRIESCMDEIRGAMLEENPLNAQKPEWFFRWKSKKDQEAGLAGKQGKQMEYIFFKTQNQCRALRQYVRAQIKRELRSSAVPVKVFDTTDDRDRVSFE
jgi:hypothetical protein